MSYYIDNKESYFKLYDARKSQLEQGSMSSSANSSDAIRELEESKNRSVNTEKSNKDTRLRQLSVAHDAAIKHIKETFTKEATDAERRHVHRINEAEQRLEKNLGEFYDKASTSLVTMPPYLTSPSDSIMAPILNAAPTLTQIQEQAAQRTYLPQVLVGMQEIAYGQKKCILPKYIPWQSLDDKTTATEGNIMVLYDRDKAERRVMDLVDSMLIRMMMAFPVGNLHLSIIDPTNQSIQRITQVMEKSEELFYKKVFKTDEEINVHLKMLTDKIDPIKQSFKSFQNTSLSLVQHNKNQIKHEYELVVIYEPFNERIGFADNLKKLMMNGISAGIYVMLVQSNYKKEELISGFDFDSFSSIIRANKNDIELMTGTRVQWNSKFKEFEGGDLDDCEYLPTKGVLVDPIAINGALVQEFFKKINDVWSTATDQRTVKELANWGDSSYEDSDCWLNGIKVPIGINVDKKEDVYYRADCQDYVHSFVLGTTGSGKSKLLCDIISTVTMTYSPKAVQLYLFDFKNGLSFQYYKDVPHVRWMVTTKADKTMFLTVLQDLKEEQKSRDKLFIQSGVDNLNDYNKKMLESGGECLPRVLLVVDECHEIYDTEGEKGLLRVQKQINELFELFARQYRSYGIHMLLSSQQIPGDMTWISMVNNNYILNTGRESCSRLLPQGQERMAEDIQKRIGGMKGADCVYSTKDGAYLYIRQYKEYKKANDYIIARAKKQMNGELSRYVCKKWTGELNVPYCKVPISAPTEFGVNLTGDRTEGIDFYETNNVLLYGAQGGDAARQLTMRIVLTMLRGQLIDQKMTADKSQCATVYIINGWEDKTAAAKRSRSWLQAKANPIEQSSKLLRNLAEHGYIQLVDPDDLGELLLQFKKQIDNKQAKESQLYILGTGEIDILRPGSKIESAEASVTQAVADDRPSYVKSSYMSGGYGASKTASQEGIKVLLEILKNGPAFGIHTILQIDERTIMKDRAIPSRDFQHFVFQQSASFVSWPSDNAALDIETKLEQLPVDEATARILWHDSKNATQEPLLVPFMLTDLVAVDERGDSVGQYIMDNTKLPQ